MAESFPLLTVTGVAPVREPQMLFERVPEDLVMLLVPSQP